MKMEIRTLNAALRASKTEDAFELNGRAVTYHALSQDLGGFRERFLPGAFTRSLASDKTDVRCYFNHDPSKILGRQSNGTLQLFDSPEGLNFRCQLDPKQQAHRDLHSSIKRGDINSCSFAFSADPDGDDWDDQKEERGGWFKRRTVRSAQIFDVSCVTNAAYEGATSVTARSSNSRIIVPREKSLEQRFFEATGREARHFIARPSAQRHSETLEARLARQAKEIRGEQFSGFMSADEKEYWARQFAARTGLEIKTWF